MRFQVGQRVVVIKDDPIHLAQGESFPAVGEVCTVRDIGTLGDEVSIRLVEYRNPEIETTIGKIERWAPASYFRPVNEIGFKMLDDIRLGVKKPEGVEV